MWEFVPAESIPGTKDLERMCSFPALYNDVLAFGGWLPNRPLELCFLRCVGPCTQTVGRYKYYVSFTWIYLLKFKSEVFKKFHEFQTLVESLFDRKIIVMQTDWDDEYEKLYSFFTKMLDLMWAWPIFYC